MKDSRKQHNHVPIQLHLVVRGIPKDNSKFKLREDPRYAQRLAGTAEASTLTLFKIQKRDQVNFDSDSSADEPLFVTQSRRAASNASSSTEVSQARKELPRLATSKAVVDNLPETSSINSSSSLRGTLKTRGGGGATRGGSSLRPQNVFTGGKAPRKQKPTLIEAARDSSKAQRLFSNRHILRTAELKGRQLEDQRPDPASIRLIKPSKTLDVQQPETVQRPSSMSQNEEGSRRMAPAKTPPEQPQVAQPLHPSEMSWEEVQKIPYQKRTICFFSTQPRGCHNNRCEYVHEYDPRLPVAPPPDGWPQPQRICFFYNSDGNCRRGDACHDLHESGTGIPVREPPPERVPPDPSTKGIQSETQVSDNPDSPKLICYYWYHENCSKGAECNYAHSTDNNLVVAPQPPKPLSVICRFWNWENIESCRKGKSCPYKHEYPQDNDTVGYTSQINNSPANMNLSKQENSHPSLNNSKYTSSIDTSAANVEISGQESSNPSLNKSKSTQIFCDDDTIDFGMDTDMDIDTGPYISPLQPIITETEQLNFDKYITDDTVQDTPTQVKTVTFGPQAQLTKLDFTNLPQINADWTRAFACAETLKFDQICTVHDFRSKYGKIQQSAYWQQDVKTDFTDQDGCDTVNRIAEYLCLRMSGLACVSDIYIILLYPVSAEEWRFLDLTPNLSTDATLRYLVFKSQGSILSSIKSSTTSQTSPTDLSHRDMMMKNFHSLDYERLTIDQKSKKSAPINFCLIFPASAQSTMDLIASWLKSCSKDGKIYNYQKPGCWNYLKKQVKTGVVLIHSSALGLISDTDLVEGMTAGMEYSFFSIKDDVSGFALSRVNQEPELGRIVASRLLPLCYAILLTPSFLVAEPVMTLNFLKWYQKKLKSSITGLYKVLCCHELPSFLMELFISKVEEQQQLMKSLTGDPLMLSKLSAKGLSHEQCEARLKSYSLVCELFRKDIPSTGVSHDFDPSDQRSRSPFLFAPPSIDQNDEKKLVSWFVYWSFANFDRYRRFYVIGSGNSEKSTGIPVRMIPEERLLPQNSEAFRRGGTLAFARPGMVSPTSDVDEEPLEKSKSKLKEFQFDLTDEWYPQWRNTEEGQHSNHIIEYRWDRVFDSLKVHY